MHIRDGQQRACYRMRPREVCVVYSGGGACVCVCACVYTRYTLDATTAPVGDSETFGDVPHVVVTALLERAVGRVVVAVGRVAAPSATSPAAGPTPLDPAPASTAPASTSATAAPSPPSAAAPHSGSSDFDFGRYMASRAAAVNAALDAAVPAVYPEAVTESMR